MFIGACLETPRLSLTPLVVEDAREMADVISDPIPGRFSGLLHARGWLAGFFGWANDEHHHSGLALFTPADVFYDRVEVVRAVRLKWTPTFGPRRPAAEVEPASASSVYPVYPTIK